METIQTDWQPFNSYQRAGKDNRTSVRNNKKTGEAGYDDGKAEKQNWVTDVFSVFINNTPETMHSYHYISNKRFLTIIENGLK